MTTLAEPPAAPAPAPARDASRGRWLIAAATVWGVVLLLAGYWSARHDPPTVKEQRTLAEAAPVVDAAAGELVAAAGRDVVVELSDRQLREGCRFTAATPGATLERTVTLRTSEADAPALLDRVAAALPARYEASASHRGSVHRLRADAGEFVAVSGAVTGPGVVALTATTGCRRQVGSDAVDMDLLMLRPFDAVPVRLLTALGATGAENSSGSAVSCPNGGLVMSSGATGSGPWPSPAALRAAAGPGAVVVTQRPDLYAYRTAATSVVIRRDATTLTATATAYC